MEIKLDSSKIMQALLLAAALALGGLLWGIDGRVTVLESGEAIRERVERLETAMLPVLVDWKVQAELEKRLAELPEDEAPAADIPEELPDSRETFSRRPNRDTKSRLRKDAEKWAKEQIKQQAPVSGE